MPKVRSPRRVLGRGVRNRKSSAVARTVPIIPAPLPEVKPVRGVKLSTVSTLTMIFALLCLAAFAAGRPPVIAAGTSRTVSSAKGGSNVSRIEDCRLPGKRSHKS
jgi:hypothetical protein